MVVGTKIRHEQAAGKHWLSPFVRTWVLMGSLMKHLLAIKRENTGAQLFDHSVVVDSSFFSFHGLSPVAMVVRPHRGRQHLLN